MSKDIWKEFFELNNMTEEEIKQEVLFMYAAIKSLEYKNTGKAELVDHIAARNNKVMVITTTIREMN